MSTPEKEPVKVTSGKDTAAFVAAKPAAAKAPEQKAPEEKGPSADEVALHEKRMKELDEQYEKRKAEVAAEEQRMKDEATKRAQAILDDAREEATEIITEAQASANAKDHPTNSRGAPIPVEQPTNRPRHISEIGDSYNGKEDTIRDRSDG
jgi:hypothetical protein